MLRPRSVAGGRRRSSYSQSEPFLAFLCVPARKHPRSDAASVIEINDPLRGYLSVTFLDADPPSALFTVMFSGLAVMLRKVAR